jgi:hypothetical protein
MKYRGVALGLEQDGHPVMVLGNSLKPVEEWAAYMAKKYKRPVEIYVTEEKLLTTVPAVVD